MKNKKTLKNDILLIAVILFLTAIAIASLLVCRQAGDMVEVRVDGELIASYPLNTDTTIELSTGKDKTGKNTMVIKGGQVSVSQADCPDHICVDHHPISYDGESIICLPNKMVISINKAG